MDSLTFRPGRAFLSSNSPAVPWTAVFEDEGDAGYFYACDRSQETQDHAILDGMLVYNVAALKDREAERLATVEWSRDGQQVLLRLDGVAQALADFRTHTAMCRTNFPNFQSEQGERWDRSGHAWSDERLARFEAGQLG